MDDLLFAFVKKEQNILHFLQQTKNVKKMMQMEIKKINQRFVCLNDQLTKEQKYI